MIRLRSNLIRGIILSSMSDPFKLLVKGFAIIVILNSGVAKAQILRDSISLNLVKESVDNIYNLKFKEVREGCSKLRVAFPGHPVTYLLEGITIYWENYPLSPSSPASAAFESNLRKCIELCEAKNKQAEEAEILLTDLSARGMLLLYYADNDLTMSVIPLAASTYPYIRRSFEFTATYTDFFFFTGLYNYTREAYPEAYPVYKTVAFLFPKGDRMKGLSELQLAAKESILFKAESALFLSGVSLSIENNQELAYEYIRYLHELYPANLKYLAIYIKNLLLVKRYDEAEKLLKYSASINDNSFFQAQLSIFNGIIQEKKYHNDRLAEQNYMKGVKDISAFGPFADEYAAYGYFGLSRISSRNGNDSYMKTYRKKAYELADFKKIDFN